MYSFFAPATAVVAALLVALSNILPAQCITGTANQSIAGCPGNLVPNPSFEAVDTCACFDGNTGDFWFNDASYLTDWTEPSQGSSDFYHTCNAGPSNDGVPANNFGIQTPRTGNGYAHFMTYGSGSPPYREYLQTRLTSPLVAGRSYEVSFYVSKTDQSRWATNNIGAHLSTLPVTLGGFNVLPVTAHILESNVISDATNWTLITGTYTATGGEEYLTIGNFFSDPATTRVDLGQFFLNAGYYLDDVCVSDLTPLDAGQIAVQEGLPALPGEWEVVLKGNPLSFESRLSVAAPEAGRLRLSLMSAEGKLIREEVVEVSAGKSERDWFQGLELAGGYYFFSVQNFSGHFQQRLPVLVF